MHPKKSLGQNFLKCQWVIDALIEAGEVTKKDTVLEIGPGTGVLTRPLAKHAEKVVALEKDEALADILSKNLKAENINNVEVIEGDILKEYCSLISRYAENETSIKIVANIPYYLTSHLFRIIFETNDKPKLVLFTIQKEVAERITAKPPSMSMLALSIQAYGTPTIIKNVPASCFSPVPKVDSSIIKISEISNNFFLKTSITEKMFFEISKLGFSSKRKQLIGNLSKRFPKEKLISLFSELNINPQIRAEALTKEDWAKIIKHF